MSPNPQEPADLATFTEEILNGKLHFLCSVSKRNEWKFPSKEYNGKTTNLWKCKTYYDIQTIVISAKQEHRL